MVSYDIGMYVHTYITHEVVKQVLLVLLCALCRKLFSLTENKESGTWTNRNVCLGSSSVCHDGLLGAGHLRFILSFAEDEDGMVYVSCL